MNYNNLQDHLQPITIIYKAIYNHSQLFTMNYNNIQDDLQSFTIIYKAIYNHSQLFKR